MVISLDPRPDWAKNEQGKPAPINAGPSPTKHNDQNDAGRNNSTPASKKLLPE